MESFTRIIRPGTVDTGNGRRANVYCKVSFSDDGRLSITGVEGPLSSGNALGACGQIDMHLSEPDGLDSFEPAEGWTLESFREFLAVWREWHLNDMRAFDAEMKAAGWRELAARPMLGFKFSLTRAAYDARREGEAAALAALKAGETFTPTPEQSRIAALPLSLTIWAAESEAEPAPPTPDYERSRHAWGHNVGAIEAAERKTLGWLYPSDHPDGLLTRKLRPDGNAYGSNWYREEVPADVLAYLAALPESDLTPAWI